MTVTGRMTPVDNALPPAEGSCLSTVYLPTLSMRKPSLRENAPNSGKSPAPSNQMGRQ
jgi:hypothetical protein